MRKVLDIEGRFETARFSPSCTPFWRRRGHSRLRFLRLTDYDEVSDFLRWHRRWSCLNSPNRNGSAYRTPRCCGPGFPPPQCSQVIGRTVFVTEVYPGDSVRCLEEG